MTTILEQTMTAAPVAFMPLDQAAKTYSCSTRSLLRANERKLLKLSRPFGSGGKIYVSTVDLTLFFSKGYRTPPDHVRGKRLTNSRRRNT